MRGVAVLVRALVLVLVASIGSAGALPVLVQIAEGSVHVCRCSAATHECLCLKCHPDDPSLLTTDDALKGQCGDDQRLLSPTTFKALATVASVLLPAAEVGVLEVRVPVPSTLPRPPPPTPPPLAALAV